MPLPDDRMSGRCQTLAYPEAVLLLNPKMKELTGEVLFSIMLMFLFIFVETIKPIFTKKKNDCIDLLSEKLKWILIALHLWRGVECFPFCMVCYVIGWFLFWFFVTITWDAGRWQVPVLMWEQRQSGPWLDMHQPTSWVLADHTQWWIPVWWTSKTEFNLTCRPHYSCSMWLILEYPSLLEFLNVGGLLNIDVL